MFKQVSILLFTTLAALVHGVRPLPPNAALPNQQGLASLFFSSRISGQDPVRSMSCFADYIDESNVVSEKYRSSYNNCLVKSSESRKQVDNQALNERQGIETSAESVCSSMRSCNQQESTLDVFNCHANVGSNNTKATYTISGNASEYATTLQEQYRLIDLHHEQCCNAAERAYVEDTAHNYNYLQDCLNGSVQPRPPKQSSTTTTTSTAAPTTTTTTTTTTTEPPSPPPPTTTATPAQPRTDSSQSIQEQFQQLLNLLN